jgi:hypothetical protein
MHVVQAVSLKLLDAGAVLVGRATLAAECQFNWPTSIKPCGASIALAISRRRFAALAGRANWLRDSCVPDPCEHLLKPRWRSDYTVIYAGGVAYRFGKKQAEIARPQVEVARSYRPTSLRSRRRTRCVAALM